MEYNYFEMAKKIQKYWEEHDEIVRGFINDQEVKFIEDTLRLEELSEIQITNIYNFIGLYFDNQLLAMRLNREMDQYIKINDCLSATKAVIYRYMK